MNRIVFATNNKNKLQEAKLILAKQYEVLSLEDIGCSEELPETHETLEENALEKARFVYDLCGVACFADDTGLEIAALKGAPGVYSARYYEKFGPGDWEEDHIAALNMRLVLDKLSDVQNRDAQFRTVVALILENGTYQFQGKVEGQITNSLSGNDGFGYDPIFIPENDTRTFAEMSIEDKNLISHRGKAFRKLADYLLSRE